MNDITEANRGARPVRGGSIGGAGAGVPLCRLAGLLAVLAVASCTSIHWRARFLAPQKYGSLDRTAPFLKCHTADGQVYVLEKWVVEKGKGKDRILGTGLLYGVDRTLKRSGAMEIPLSKIALLETNTPHRITRSGLVALAFITPLSLAGTVACLAMSKACFGSCPTFYAHDGKRMTLQAEGFSSSVARVLEATDVDTLFTARVSGRRFKLLMTNEALETHAVRTVRVLAVPRAASARVFRAASGYYPANALRAPYTCRSALGNCRDQVEAIDDLQYLSPADQEDLATKETIELTFPAVSGQSGLVVAARNSLLNTFLFYQTLAYMGASAGEWMMKLERGDPRALRAVKGVGRLLGDVEVSVLTRRRGWVAAGSFSEVGPIARDVQLILFPTDLPRGPVRVRLKLTKGNWKLDYLALAELGSPVKPIPLVPDRVLRRGKDDPDALKRLRSPNAYLVTYPGDAYTLEFALPGAGRSFELFLESRGYYYEWIRGDWLREENPVKVTEVLLEPAEALRRLAPLYKRVEPRMEELFWSSRIGGRP